MDKPHARNNLDAAVTKFCLAVEEHRRTPEGRVRTSQDFLTHFFPHDDKGSSDQVFRYLPNDVRGPILSAWGIRGLKAALRDTDTKVESVVYDALVAGDVDHAAFEHGLSADTLVRWVPLHSWWSFWRAGKLSKKAILKAFEVAHEVGLLDAKWFFDTVESKGGKVRGTDVVAEGLTKSDLTEWLRRIHQSGDGTPRGLVAALGWEKIVNQTATEVLVAALDALAAKAHLATAGAPLAPRPVSYAPARIVELRESDAPELQLGVAEVSAGDVSVDLDDEIPGKDTLKDGAQATLMHDPLVIPSHADEDDGEDDIEPTAVFHVSQPPQRGSGRSR